MRLWRTPEKVAQPQADAASISATSHLSGQARATVQALTKSMMTASHSPIAVSATLLM